MSDRKYWQDRWDEIKNDDAPDDALTQWACSMLKTYVDEVEERRYRISVVERGRYGWKT